MDRVSFKINGVDYSVGCEVSSSVMLLDYIRDYLELRGTKYMCRQAGCGACMVTARRPPGAPYAVNACILPIIACDGLEITTIEAVGNRKKGYHPLQTTLAEHNGSQCGYCSPGWVMAMYSLLQSKKALTMLEIEQSFASNICRCTGYRPILEAFKKFAKDAPKNIEIPDIEDLRICDKNEKSCNNACEDEDWCILSTSDLIINNGIIGINLKDGKTWYKANRVADIFNVLNTEGYDSYKLICGNTATGVYPEDEIIDNARVLIDISEAQDLIGYSIDQNLIIGGETTLTKLLGILETVSEQEYFGYLKILYDHILLVAHIAVRNVGSIAGNLMIKHRHNEFQSDLFLLFETIGAQLTISKFETEFDRRHPRYKSGAIKLHESRPVSDGRQIYDTNPGLWPINQPIPKIEGLIQCAGEATYTDDIPTFPKEVYGAFVLSTVGKGHIVLLDASVALSYPGVIAFYSAKDIPGLNSFTPADDPVYSMNEEVFCSGQVKYYNQPLGLIVADTQDTADKAANLVEVKYTNIEKPVVDIKTAKKDTERNILFREIKATVRGQDVSKVIKGGNTIKGQYHFPIETLVSVTKPIEEGLAVYATAQWTGAMQVLVSRALKIDQSKIDIHVRRLGGSYGIKISRTIQTAVASSLVAMKLNRPCRITQRMETNMRAMGKRFACSTDFEVDVNKSGVFQYIDYNLYEDNGYAINENLSQFGVNVYNNCYNTATWNYKCINTLTDTAKNTWFRSPGTLENIAMAELMMEQISYELSVDPIQLRLANLDPRHYDLNEMFQTIATTSDYATRRTAVNKFNAENRWKKRGLRVVFLRWEHIYARYFDVNLAVYQADGTVAISHGGVELGQGINTKAAQIAASMLNIPIEKVVIKENNTISSPNAAVTGGSLTTQNIMIAVEKCCEQLLARLEPVKRQLNNATWEQLVKKSFEMYVDLQAHGFAGQNDVQSYEIYGVTVAEMEIDVLTGESEILRVDVLQDTGQSVNPKLDVGQVEGALVMGLGYWTCENLVYDTNTGELLTDRTWNYYVPQARDIPQDFRVYLRKKSYSTKAIFGSKVSSTSLTQTVTMQQFLKLDMKAKVILNVMLPPLNKQYKLVTFKVMPRSQNAHAIVHSGFLFKLTPDNFVLQTRIVIGGLSPGFIRAAATEQFLVRKSLFRNETLQAAVQILKAELVVTEDPPAPSAAYRRQLALGLFYKGLLTSCPDTLIHPRYKSGAIKLHESRPVSDGRQIYDTNPGLWPINQPIPKIEGLIQCAGEATYTDDIPTFPKEVYGAFVLSTVGKGHIVLLDASVALSYPGVIAFYSAKDIPGLNSFTPADDPVYSMNEEVFCSGQVKYYNQPLGLIVADTQDTADKAANLVEVKYTNIEKPVVDIKTAKKDTERNILFREIKATVRGQDVSKVIKGGNTIKGQYHFPIETLVSVTKPIEEGLAVYATAQWTGAMQVLVSRALKIDQSKIDIHVRRLGGSYGIKISRTIQTAVASSLVAMKLNRPCRITQRMETNMRAMGKRFACSTDFEVDVNKSGVFQYIDYNLYEDNGYAINENLSQFGVNVYNNCYNTATWNYKCINTLTDTAKNTWFRSPGTLENIAMAELMMEQISYELSVDPIQLRLANLDPRHYDLNEMFQTIATTSDYATRRTAVNKFNAENRWKKRGLRVVFLRWEHIYARYFDVNLAVYQADGTVAISHGGVELGQGINTKAAQIAASMLNIPIEKVVIKENNTISSPNAAVTGGSLTTQNIMIAVEKCCEQLLARLEPVKRQLNNATWEQLVKKSFEMYVDLQAHGFAGQNDVQSYEIYGVTVAEMEIDVLTGESEILRVDVLQDTGQSVNPKLDVGQVEGALVMGLGYWTCENLVYDTNTGELLTDRTWNYYVPQARDIPQDFRVYLRKKSYSTKAIFGSKACSEPPMCMSVSIPIAMREAIVSARQESGLPSTKWFTIDGPYTTEQICLACETNIEDFKFN